MEYRHHLQYAQPTKPAHLGVKLLEHVWNAEPGGIDDAVPGMPFFRYGKE